ncbi:MAG: glycosyltransferase family 2 protein, partial [Sphingomonas taxi]
MSWAADRPQTVRVSVAMGTFNGERHLRAQLDSMVRQSRRPDELVVSDDGSTDATIAMLEAFRSTAPFDVRILHSEGRLGVTRNFERAMAACTGDFILLSDQDDVWTADRVERLIAALQAAPDAGYAFSNAQIMSEDGTLQDDTLWSRIGLSEARRIRYHAGTQMPVLLNGPNFIYGMAMAIRRAFIADVLPIVAQSPSCTHDTWTALAMSGAGHHGVMVDACLVHYRQHSKQVVGAGQTRETGRAAVRQSLRSARRYDPQFPPDLEILARKVAETAPEGAGARGLLACCRTRQRICGSGNKRRNHPSCAVRGRSDENFDLVDMLPFQNRGRRPFAISSGEIKAVLQLRERLAGRQIRSW